MEMRFGFEVLNNLLSNALQKKNIDEIRALLDEARMQNVILWKEHDAIRSELDKLREEVKIEWREIESSYERIQINGQLAYREKVPVNGYTITACPCCFHKKIFAHMELHHRVTGINLSVRYKVWICTECEHEIRESGKEN